MAVYKVREEELLDTAEFGYANQRVTDEHGWLWRDCDQAEAVAATDNPIDEPLRYYKSVATGEMGAWLDCELIGDDDGDLPSAA